MTEQQGYDPDTAHRFTYHPPTPEQPEVYQLVRDVAHLFVILVEASTFPSRERSLALTNAEQAVMWANAAIARRGLSDAAHAGARDLFDLALEQLRAAKPGSAVIEDDGVHWSPVTVWERAAKDAHAALTAEDSDWVDRTRNALAILGSVMLHDTPATDLHSDESRLHAELIQRARQALIGTGHFTEAQVGIDLAPRITELWSALHSPAEDEVGHDPWPPDGHVTGVLRPLPAGFDPDTLRAGLLALASRHSDAIAPAYLNCPACWAQIILNGGTLPLPDGTQSSDHDGPDTEHGHWNGVCPFCPAYICTTGHRAQRDAQEWVLDHAEQAHGRNLR